MPLSNEPLRKRIEKTILDITFDCARTHGIEATTAASEMANKVFDEIYSRGRMTPAIASALRALIVPTIDMIVRETEQRDRAQKIDVRGN